MTERHRDNIQIAGNYQHKAYHKGPAPQKKWHQYKYEEAIHALELANGDRVLDIGCGSGVTSDLIAKNAQIHVTGIDSNPEAIDFCKKEYSRSNLNFSLLTIGMLKELGQETAEKILFLETIEHITTEQAKQAAAAMYQILKPGGKLVVSTPNKKSLWPLQEWLLDRLHIVPSLKNDQHERLYNGKELEHLFTEAGFTTARKETINFLAPWAALVSNRLADKIHRWERNRSWVPGSLLLYIFRKN
jgi:2-polyprenyl-3-methyl-5-hydroxy-6-metoxy-1,4-benzoquinol methylase